MWLCVFITTEVWSQVAEYPHFYFPRTLYELLVSISIFYSNVIYMNCPLMSCSCVVFVCLVRWFVILKEYKVWCSVTHMWFFFLSYLIIYWILEVLPQGVKFKYCVIMNIESCKPRQSCYYCIKLWCCIFQYSSDLLRKDPDHLLGLVMEIVPDSSCLMFCATKKHCENVAKMLSKLMESHQR